MILRMIKRIITYGDEVELNISQNGNTYHISIQIFVLTRMPLTAVENIILGDLWRTARMLP